MPLSHLLFPCDSCVLLLFVITHYHCPGVKVDAVTSASGSEPAVVQLSGGGSINASKGVVVAVEGPEAARLLGQALQVSAGL